MDRARRTLALVSALALLFLGTALTNTACHAATETILPMMLASTSVFWTCPARDLPVGWDEVRSRVQAHLSAAGRAAQIAAVRPRTTNPARLRPSIG